MFQGCLFHYTQVPFSPQYPRALSPASSQEPGYEVVLFLFRYFL